MPGREIEEFRDLTIGKVYDIFHIKNIDPYDNDTNQYCITDDSGKESWYIKSNFKWLDEHRSNQIDKII